MNQDPSKFSESLAFLVATFNDENNLKEIATTDDSGKSWSLFHDLQSAIVVASDIEKTDPSAKILCVRIETISLHDPKGNVI